ncbi:MAG: FAD-dependent oxidoreductase [bacterium]|nr:FAD-dependent oxidoreductase [bacterium]
MDSTTQPESISAALSTPYPALFSAFRLKNVTLRNRIVMLPHVTFYGGHNFTPSARHHYYYAERAKGGVGLIVTESQFVHASSAVHGCVDASSLDGMRLWQPTIAAVHEHGAAFFAQITHHSIQGASADSYLPLIAPSAIPDATVREVPKAADRGDMDMIRDAYRAAAGNVRSVGFDGVELKVGHDGILRAFMSPYFNRRSDEYGGSRENRLRYVIEVLRAVRAEVGEDYPVGIRFCMDECIPGGYTFEDGLWYAGALAESGLIDYLSSDLGTWMSVDAQVPPMSTPQMFMRDHIRQLKAAVSIPVIAFGRIKHPHDAESMLAQRDADLIGMTRQLIADPEWANKARTGRTAEIRPCVACNQECVGRLVKNQPIGCVHNPAAGHEETLGIGTLSAAPATKRVLVIGGGVMGLKAAETAALRGHQVILIEQNEQLGGQVAIAARAPGHEEWGEIAAHLIAQIARLDVQVMTNTPATVDTVAAFTPDAVIVATGSRLAPLPFAQKGALTLLDEWQVMQGDDPWDERVLLLDLGVRFEGAALAETLVARRNQVTWIAPTPTVGFEIDPPTLIPLRRRLAAHGAALIPETTVIETDDDAVLTLNVFTGDVKPLAGFDSLVIAGNKLSNNGLIDALRPHVAAVYAGGDCVAPRHVAIAIREGDRLGRTV